MSQQIVPYNKDVTTMNKWIQTKSKIPTIALFEFV